MLVQINKLREKLQFVYPDQLKFPKGKSIETAIQVYKDIKKYERAGEDGKVDYGKELLEAKYDLQIIFNTNFKGMSKNNIYMAHQSLWVNAVYAMLNGKEK